MANLSYLFGCSSGDDAIARAMYGGGPDLPDTGPDRCARFSIPLFWLAAFDATDRLWFERAPDPEFIDDEAVTFPIYWSTTAAAVARLRARTPIIVAITGETFAAFYQEWIAFVERSYPVALMLQAEEVLDLDGVAQSGPRLHASIEGLQAGVLDKELRATLHRNGTIPFEPGGGKRSAEEAANHCRARLAGSSVEEEDLEWPTPASPAEIMAMAAVAAARPWWRFWG